MPRRNSILRTSPLRRTVLVRRQPSRQALRLPKSIFPQNPLPSEYTVPGILVQYHSSLRSCLDPSMPIGICLGFCPRHGITLKLFPPFSHPCPNFTLSAENARSMSADVYDSLPLSLVGHSPSRLRGEHAPRVLLEASAIVRSRPCALLLINTLRPLPATATMTTTTTTTSPRAER